VATKKILNLYEEVTQRSLKEVCDKYGALVFAKVRVADVLVIEHTGISDAEYRFALQSHFDFVVTDDAHSPQFAVEFDGPLHANPEQRDRDRIKNNLCKQLSVPLLRINARYLPKKYRNIDLLGWFVEAWFFQQAFAEAQEDGLVSPDEPCDPLSVLGLPGRKERFPLWLSAELRVKIQGLNKRGKCHDSAPSEWYGKDSKGNYHGIMWIRVTKDSGVMVRSGIRSQQFPLIGCEILSELLVFQLYEELDAVVRGDGTARPFSEINAAIRRYEAKYEPRGSATVA